jgi:hypothetical protein
LCAVVAPSRGNVISREMFGGMTCPNVQESDQCFCAAATLRRRDAACCNDVVSICSADVVALIAPNIDNDDADASAFPSTIRL